MTTDTRSESKAGGLISPCLTALLVLVLGLVVLALM